MFLALLFDPRLFNYVLLALFGLNVIRWGWEGDYIQVVYWFGAIFCTAGVTFTK